jgi:hypothetical protein
MHKKFSLFFLASCLLACTPQTPSVSSSPTPSSSIAPPEVGSPAPQSTATPTAPITAPTTAPALSPSQPVAIATGKPGQDLSLIQSISIEASKRFLDGQGESVVLKPVLKDAAGQTLNSADFPLQWFSSRPTDFSVDASGKVTALVDYGYSMISLKIPGTNIEAQQQLSVNAIASSGGGSAPKPTRESISGSVKFDF